MSQALGDSDFPSVLKQLLPLMKPRGVQDGTTAGSRSGEDECGPDELILLLVYLYSLADEAQPADRDGEDEELDKLERELMGALTLVITREPELSPLLQKLTGKRPRTWSLFPEILRGHSPKFGGDKSAEERVNRESVSVFPQSSSGAANGKILSKSLQPITLPLVLKPTPPCSPPPHNLLSLARSRTNSGVWESLSSPV